MLMFTLCISRLTTSNLLWFMDLTFQIPMQYCSLQQTYFHDLSHQQLGVSFLFVFLFCFYFCCFLFVCFFVLLWLCLFIFSGVISPLFSSSILGTHWPGEFIFQCHIFLPFHTVCGVLKARILNWFAIPFSSGPHFVRNLHHDLSFLGGPTRHGSCFYWIKHSCGLYYQFDLFSVIFIFILSALWRIRIIGLLKLPDGRDLLWGKLGLILMGRAMLSSVWLFYHIRLCDPMHCSTSGFPVHH